MSYATNETQIPVNLAFSLIYRQLTTGCGNPMCENKYCKSGNSFSPVELLDQNGRIVPEKIFKLMSDKKNIDDILCRLPLKAILSRVQTIDRKFDPKLQMFEPRRWNLGTPSFSTLLEAESPLTCPFPNEILFRLYLIDSPTRSFKKLNEFLGVGVTSVLDEYFCFVQWFTIVKARGLLYLLYGYLISLIDNLASYIRQTQFILQEELSAITPIAFLLLMEEDGEYLDKAPYNYSSGERNYQISLNFDPLNATDNKLNQNGVTLRQSLERLIADSSDEFKIKLIHVIDTLIPLLRNTYPLGEFLSDVMGPAPLIPVYDMKGTNTDSTENEMAERSRDTTFKFVHKDLDLSSLGSNSSFICPSRLCSILNSSVTRIGKALRRVAGKYHDDLPIRKTHIDEDTQYEINCSLKILDMLWFINMKYHFTKIKNFIVPEVNDNQLYNLINDFDVFIAISKSAEEEKNNGLIVRGDKLLFSKMLEVPNFCTSPFSLRVRFYINTGQTERCSAFSFLLHPFLLTSSVKSRIIATELRLNRTADIPVIPQFIPGFAIPITGIEYERAIPLIVSRDDLVHDTISGLSKIPTRELSRSQLKVKFKGEEGIDEGGVSMEYFNLIMDKLVNPKYGHFIPVGENIPIDYGTETDEEYIDIDVESMDQTTNSEENIEQKKDSEGAEGRELLKTPKMLDDDIKSVDENQTSIIDNELSRSTLWFNKLTDLYHFKHSCITSDNVIIPVPPYLVPDTCGQLSSTQSTEELMYYTGMLFGLAINNSVVMDVEMPKVFYRKLASLKMGGTSGTEIPKYMLNESLFTLTDMASINSQMASSLSSLIDLALDHKTTDEDIDALELYQSADTMYRGELVSIPLLPNQLSRYAPQSTISDAIPKVTRATASDFVKAYVKHECSDGVRSLFTPFKNGFKAVLGCATFCLLAPSDIRHCLVGSQVSNETVEELETYCSYEGFGKRDIWVFWFWGIVKSWDVSKIKKLLKFITGSSRIGVAGARGLNLKIIANGDGDLMLPTSHVCFNTLMLPKYTKREIMEERLLTAIHNSEGFGLR